MARGGEPPAWSESPGWNPVSLWYNVEPVTPIKDQGSWQYLINRRDTSSRQTSPTRTMGSTSTTGWTIILPTILISGQAQGEQLILQIFLTFGLVQVHQLQNNSRDINLHGGIEKVVIIFHHYTMSDACSPSLVMEHVLWHPWYVDPHCSKSKVDNKVSNWKLKTAGGQQRVHPRDLGRLQPPQHPSVPGCQVWVYLDHTDQENSITCQIQIQNHTLRGLNLSWSYADQERITYRIFFLIITTIK